MFGLEGEKKPQFEFDLEKDIKKSKELADNITKEVESHLTDVEKQMKENGKSEELSKIAYGYKAAKKVLGNIHN